MPLNAPSNPAWTVPRKRTRSSKPRLPAELESIVLNNFQSLHSPEDLIWLWIGGRHVSTHFRDEIERIFRTVFLPRTILHCDLGIHILCWDVFTFGFSECHAGLDTGLSAVGDWVGRTPCFTLDRFSDDRTRAYLKCGECEAPKKIVFRRLHEKQLVGAPVFSIQVHGVVNDTGLPDLQIDDEKEEVSFDWKGILDRLLGEEHVFNTILSQRLGWHLNKAEDTGNLLETHRKLARRSRLQRECRAKYRSNIVDHYVHDERPALKNLQQLRLAASAAEHNNNAAIFAGPKPRNNYPDGVIVYSDDGGDSSPGPSPGSIPRGLFTDRDYSSPSHQWMRLPPPSAVDLFSPLPLPKLGWGRQPTVMPAPTSMAAPQRPKQQQNPSHGKRAREESLVVSSKKRGKLAAD